MHNNMISQNNFPSSVTVGVKSGSSCQPGCASAVQQISKDSHCTECHDHDDGIPSPGEISRLSKNELGEKNQFDEDIRVNIEKRNSL